MVAAALALSRSFEAVPFSGLATFYLFSLWARNLALNRLLRFSIQQAILLDVALILPGLGGSVAAILSVSAALIHPSTILPPSCPSHCLSVIHQGGTVDADLARAGSSATFFAMLVCVGYSVLLTALGREPSGIPFISERVMDRVGG